MRSFFLLFLFIGFGIQPLLAQQTFEEWKKKQIREYQDFKDSRDQEFMNLLDSAWRAVSATETVDFYEEPKPVYIPKVTAPAVPDDRTSGGTFIEKISIPRPEKSPGTEQVARVPEPKDLPTGYRESEVDFYAVPVSYSYPEGFDTELGFRVDKESISTFWGRLSSARYDPILERSLEIKDRLALNDWGYVMVLYRMGQDIYGRKTNESVLFTWFMMSKAGYQAKVGYDQQGVYLLVAAENQLFNTRYFSIDHLRHYALKLENTTTIPSSLFTYEGMYPEANRKMSFSIESTPRIKKNLIRKDFTFTYGGETFDIPVKINRNMIVFFELYPLTELDIYFKASVSPDLGSSLFNSLASVIRGKSETEAANILLRFVQTAFQYQTDQQQFGYEKYLLPEETLFYPYSDCDDRTILFATLVKELLGLDVIGVRYPRHLAAAVKFTTVPEGDYVLVAGERYTIADPTYVNAGLGKTLPQYRNQEPETLVIQ